MRNLRWLLVLMIAVQFAACSKDSGGGNPIIDPPPPVNTGNTIPQVDDGVRDFMARFNVPGLSLAIVKDGKLIYARGYGFGDQTTARAVDTASLFRIASLSKPITAITILKLVEEGKLSLSAKVFGPGGVLGTEYGGQPYQNNITNITVQQLLQHTAGGWTNDANDPMFTANNMSSRELISWTIDNRPLTTTPGTTYAYSNFGYNILGRIIEKVSNKTYEEHVKSAILAPLGITRMQIGGNTEAERKTDEVKYYGQSSQNPYIYNIARMDAHGGWIGSAKDLMKLVVAADGFNTRPDILSAASIQTMTTGSSANPSYGMGWMVNSSNNWWHTGALPGTATMLARASNGFSWAILTNTRSMDANFGNEMDQLIWRAINNPNTQWPTKDLF
ncbi:class A beta-lactamase-related serine hydrolase [Segetibacter sp. 3557_3]|uniref:serine hydrolase domain-containing protein n=1 Tax=Segetibacter sp. 3557_3 TaxID=2547429 RepID=UPI001058824D|nr:serine hydrolase domain-containing protein [Segetibacter sp. 3557_3]TDH24577.1 class A beta-lactamase-related serine hydrolase [Segetibacter sp. 3557_3]